MPALADRQDLVLAEGEGGRVASQRADRSAAVRAAVRLRAVLDDDEVVFGGECDDRVHVDRPAAEVDRDDRAGPLGEHGGDGGGGDVGAVAVDVGAHRASRPRRRPRWRSR